jgi:hypothetical protein
MKIKKFNEMFSEKFDYKYILDILKNTHGWGNGILTEIDNFEENEEYFKNPIDENDYAEKFHIFLVDKFDGRLRGEFNKDLPIRVNRQTPIYAKLQ